MNNYSIFGYDGLSRNVSIVETTAGSVTSAKQFVWVGGDRNEERDGSGVLTKKFLVTGQMNSTSKYFYTEDHLASIREMEDNAGAIQAQYVFDGYGRLIKISETTPSDFGYAGYYLHGRSGMNLTLTRSYSANLGRFLNRDTIEERGGLNLFAYVQNNPISSTDPSGKDQYVTSGNTTVSPFSPANWAHASFCVDLWSCDCKVNYGRTCFSFGTQTTNVHIGNTNVPFNFPFVGGVYPEPNGDVSTNTDGRKHTTCQQDKNTLNNLLNQLGQPGFYGYYSSNSNTWSNTQFFTAPGTYVNP